MLDRREFLAASAFAGGVWVLGQPGECRAEPVPSASQKWPRNYFLQGNFAPVSEEVTETELKVIGQVPKELHGVFVRNGPNPQFPPLRHYHWFEGDGMLHAVLLRDGKASYRNRWIRTEGWKEERQAGKALYPSFLDPLDGTNPPRFKNTANTSVLWHHGRLLALWEGGPPTEVRLPDLETVGLYTFGGKLKHPFTAHPKVDPVTGEVLCFGYNLVAKPYLQYSVIAPWGQIISTTAIDLPRPVMMHDFAVTANYTVFLDLPEVFSLERALRGQPVLKFEPDAGARIGILPRKADGTTIRWFTIPPCYVFHTLNAWEEGDEVVVVACRTKQFPQSVEFAPPSDGSAHPNPQDSEAVLYQWRCHLKTGKVVEGPLDDRGTEFPRVNERLLGRRTRFGYCGRSGSEMFDGLVKYDLVKQTHLVHGHGAGRFGGEGVFVPRPDAKAEDDGWLMTYVFDRNTGKSELVVVDCRDFAAPPVARILLPVRVPYGFHGIWVDLS
ncbi:MAG: carotenoid oxygenase family protein [Gemmatales bacterium]|nr:carotenoid oxygenase family protein [Gemmatales bacterium]MDW8387276.1 carotenoid oxygenase family protein [Gemmatales bacterium]